jgi:hypothetical protein
VDLGVAHCLFDSTEKGFIGLRTALFEVSHLSTGVRREVENEEGMMDTINVDFWMHQSETNGPHHSVEIVLPSSWSANLFLCVAKR